MHTAPVSVRTPFGLRRPLIHDPARSRLDRLNALARSLVGVELGTYDRRMLDWLAGWGTPAVGILVSLLRRARLAGGAR